jgi:hypothetical protein
MSVTNTGQAPERTGSRLWQRCSTLWMCSGSETMAGRKPRRRLPLALPDTRRGRRG